MKSLAVALFEFDNEYGSFPDSTTAPQTKSATGTPISLGDHSSNQLLRQLIVHGVKTEKIFWARTSPSAHKPDDIFTSDATILAPGECAFAYVTGLSSKDDPDTPIIVSPLVSGTTRFDSEPFGGMAVVLRLDGSTSLQSIDKSGDVIVNGMPIFDPRQAFWKGKAPDIKWPE